MKLLIIVSGIALLAVLIAIMMFVFNESLFEIMKTLTYWLMITVGLGVVIGILVWLLPGLKNILK